MGRSNQSALGEYIRRQRELHEMSVRQMAKMAGISNPYLSQIERGLREPSRRVLEGIAKSLELSAETLYAEAGVDPDSEDSGSEVERAIENDQRLTQRQRKALVEIYRSFVAEG